MRKKEFICETTRRKKMVLLEQLIIDSFKDTYEKIKRVDEVFYGDSDGDYDDNISSRVRTEELYDKGLEAYKLGDFQKAAELYANALKAGSWLGWNENDLPPYDTLNSDLDENKPMPRTQNNKMVQQSKEL